MIDNELELPNLLFNRKLLTCGDNSEVIFVNQTFFNNRPNSDNKNIYFSEVHDQ